MSVKNEQPDEINVQTQKNMKKKVKKDDVKHKLTLKLPLDHPLVNFCQEVKKRQIIEHDLNETVTKALSEVPSSWWKTTLENMTPLSFRLQSALSDPLMRDKLEAILEQGPLDVKH